jgi:hypothetical protein
MSPLATKASVISSWKKKSTSKYPSLVLFQRPLSRSRQSAVQCSAVQKIIPCGGGWGSLLHYLPFSSRLAINREIDIPTSIHPVISYHTHFFYFYSSTVVFSNNVMFVAQVSKAMVLRHTKSNVVMRICTNQTTTTLSSIQGAVNRHFMSSMTVASPQEENHFALILGKPGGGKGTISGKILKVPHYYLYYANNC